MPSNVRIPFDPDDIANFQKLEPHQPFLPHKLAIHGQYGNVFHSKNFKDLVHNGGPVKLTLISPLDAFWQELPDDGKTHAIEYGGHDENVIFNSYHIQISPKLVPFSFAA